MNLFKTLTVFIILSFTVSVLHAQEPGIQFVEDKSWQEILDMSEKENKLIFLDCYTTWCGPCKMMARDVFPLKEVGDFMNPNFINTKFDMEAGEGIDLYNKYKEYIPGFPTYLLINSDGDVVHQVAGSAPAEKFIAKINDGLQAKSWVVYSKKYEAGQRDWLFLQNYLMLLEDAFQAPMIKQVTAEALPRLTFDLIKEDSSAYRIFRKYWNTTDGDILYSVLTSPQVSRKYQDRERDVNEWAGRIYERTVDQYVEKSMKPGEFDESEAKAFTDRLRNLHIAGRENLITLMLLSSAVANKDGNEFLNLYNFATEVGLLRYKTRHIGGWVTYLAGMTKDKQMLKSYLSCLKFSDNPSLISPSDYKNYAFVLERMGEKAKAKEYYKKADEAEAAIKERFKDFMK